MIRGGYIKQLSAGIYSYMPLLLKSLNKISNIIREELDKKGCQELLMPALQPSELWQETQRWERYTAIDGIMFAFEDRRGSTVCLGPTHEEVITDIVRKEITSYKELPRNLYQIQTKFRDEIRPRFGLMRAREFIMKDAYSFDVDSAGLHKSYMDMHDAYHAICKRIGFDYRCVEADAGAIGGDGGSQEFMVLADNGEDTILYCDSCDYAANQERAESKLQEYEQDPETQPMEEVFGEGLIGVDVLADFLKIPVWKTTKTLLMQADDEVVAVMVRGDCDVNEIKLKHFLGCKFLELASPETVRSVTGAEVGYAGPIGLPENVKIVADYYVGKRINLECGANKTNYHNINVNIGRDFQEPAYADLKLAKEGDFCPKCNGGKLKSAQGIEVGHIFKLGTTYTSKLGCSYLDQNGQQHPMVMGCYGIGVSRIAAACIEQNHDKDGIIWPYAIAPYQVHLVGLNLENQEIKDKVDSIYKELSERKYEVLYDDRELRAGEKFGDADLLGMPIRLTLSKRSVGNGQAELTIRKTKETINIDLDQLFQELEKAIASL